MTGQWHSIVEMNAMLPVYIILWAWSLLRMGLKAPVMSWRRDGAITDALILTIVLFSAVRNMSWWPWPLPA